MSGAKHSAEDTDADAQHRKFQAPMTKLQINLNDQNSKLQTIWNLENWNL